MKRSGQKTTANKIQIILDRIFGFILATVILIGIAGLGIEYVLVKGPSTALRNTFLATMIETRRFDWLANIYLTDEEYVELIEDIYRVDESATDSSLINAEVEVSVNEQGQNVDAYGIVDEDGDGIVLQDVTGEGFTGYMLIVYDPMRIRLGIPDIFGGTGLTVEQYCEKYNALAAVNASGFDDPNGTAWGGVPVGVIIYEGTVYNASAGWNEYCGFDSNGIMHIDAFEGTELKETDIVNAAFFGPKLIVNGNPRAPEKLVSGVNPRTAIGQRADGAVLLLVLDGRQVQSLGATYQDCCDVMIDYGAVNAYCMDGGSSSSMYYNGAYINSPSGEGGARPCPSAWIVLPESAG